MNFFPWWQVSDDINRDCSLYCVCREVEDDTEFSCFTCEISTEISKAIIKKEVKIYDKSGRKVGRGLKSLVLFRENNSNPYVELQEINNWLEAKYANQFKWKPKCKAKSIQSVHGRPKKSDSLRSLIDSGDFERVVKGAYKRLKLIKNGVNITRNMIARELIKKEYKESGFSCDYVCRHIRQEMYLKK
jgi:hypothetical protein